METREESLSFSLTVPSLQLPHSSLNFSKIKVKLPSIFFFSTHGSHRRSLGAPISSILERCSRVVSLCGQHLASGFWFPFVLVVLRWFKLLGSLETYSEACTGTVDALRNY